ncbi:MAG: CPBP family intramembrane glutamic endopeptidase [Halobacteriales archaeon]|nr:CPBP family intramembrane glutamic endopeptidase [Halobacteriales archaeon]
MPRWTFFGAAALVLTLAFVLLARRSAVAVRAALAARADPDAPPQPAVAVLESDRLLAVNVLASHGLVLVVLASVGWYAAVPVEALGVGVPTGGTLASGAALGLALAAGNEASARLADRLGFDRDERLRGLLAPDSPAGWLALLVVVLPLVAAAEELLFRAVLIGGLAAGFGVSPWLLVFASSVAFGLGHGLQGVAGVAVTAALGLALGAAFVLTGSLAVVVVAHYLVNALEFLLNERPSSA